MTFVTPLAKVQAMAALARWPGLSDSAKVVGVNLIDRLDCEMGECAPSIEAIGRDVGKSASTVKRAIRALEVDRVFIVDLGQGRTHTSRYRLNFMLLLLGKVAPVTPFTDRREFGAKVSYLHG